ncbi:hypothetical protein MEU_05578 [Candida albicans P37005]|nr:hypothetical protein MEU_05578 [Candida albicans P37005]
MCPPEIKRRKNAIYSNFVSHKTRSRCVNVSTKTYTTHTTPGHQKLSQYKYPKTWTFQVHQFFFFNEIFIFPYCSTILLEIRVKLYLFSLLNQFIKFKQQHL